MISAEYKALNEELHEERPDYGAGAGKKWGQMVNEFAKSLQTKDILDYGCGKGSLAMALPLMEVTNYDPAVPKWASKPEPHDLVICTDVLEHIEPEYLDDVLDDLVRVTRRALIVSVATRPAVKTLSDGRNAHLIVQPMEWWLPKIWSRFELISMNKSGESEFFCVCHVKEISE